MHFLSREYRYAGGQWSVVMRRVTCKSEEARRRFVSVGKCVQVDVCSEPSFSPHREVENKGKKGTDRRHPSFQVPAVHGIRCRPLSVKLRSGKTRSTALLWAGAAPDCSGCCGPMAPNHHCPRWRSHYQSDFARFWALEV